MKKIVLILLITHCSFYIAKAQWIAQNSGTNENLYDIKFLNEKTGWAVGDAGVVIKTTDGGANWINVPNPSIQYGGLMWSIQPIDSEVVYAVAGYDFIMKTTNGGSNWDVLSGRPGSITAFHSLYFMNKDTGWFLGTNKVFRTYDGGKTLDSFYAPWFTNTDIYFKDINNGIFCGTGRMFKSVDGGENWFDTNVPVGGVFHFFDKLAAFEDDVWLMSGRPVFKSTNFCETWNIIDSTPSLGSAIFFINRDTGFSGGGGNILYRTTNGGINWLRERTDPNSVAFITTVEFVNDTVGWYVCGAGRIYKTVTGGELLTNINSEFHQTPITFQLYQNYPNPFNNETNIEFVINEASIYRLEIFNMLGQKVEEIFNKKLLPGEHKISYNTGDLPSGNYIYRISSNEYSIVKRFVLLK
ncbi:MAG TPA: YCF48-related protein [Saprospiraceae bacterium]|nr:YCF48-related protein [Ignavibacteria bacterium]HRQ30584.1 YCF48-related protein [Saprospiraceae bacterium]